VPWGIFGAASPRQTPNSRRTDDGTPFAIPLLVGQADLSRARECFRSTTTPKFIPRRIIMLHYAIVFFLVALVAAFFGFGGIATDAAWIAKVLFVVFLIMALVSLVFGRRRGPVL
jgi:uncharacterized membrane protein YtjA (UPF0391 family)